MASVHIFLTLLSVAVTWPAVKNFEWKHVKKAQGPQTLLQTKFCMLLHVSKWLIVKVINILLHFCWLLVIFHCFQFIKSNRTPACLFMKPSCANKQRKKTLNFLAADQVCPAEFWNGFNCSHCNYACTITVTIIEENCDYHWRELHRSLKHKDTGQHFLYR